MLAVIMGLMLAFDMGGPVNKVASPPATVRTQRSISPSDT